MTDFQERLIDVSRDVDKLLCGKNDQEHQAILDWISAPDPLANYQKAVQLCQADTGIWFLESENTQVGDISSIVSVAARDSRMRQNRSELYCHTKCYNNTVLMTRR
jgi:hypothetical protein